MTWTADHWRERGMREAVLAGDGKAWQALYDAHFDSLYGFVFVRVGRNSHAAEEVVQETWVIAVRRIRAFDPGKGSFYDWLRGIAAKVIAGQQRRWARRNRLAQADTIADVQVKEPASLDVADHVALALTELPPNYQAVLRAKYEDQRRVAEIAEAWDVTPKAVESLLTRARVAFREAYRRLSGDETRSEVGHDEDPF